MPKRFRKEEREEAVRLFTFYICEKNLTASNAKEKIAEHFQCEPEDLKLVEWANNLVSAKPSTRLDVFYRIVGALAGFGGFAAAGGSAGAFVYCTIAGVPFAVLASPVSAVAGAVIVGAFGAVAGYRTSTALITTVVKTPAAIIDAAKDDLTSLNRWLNRENNVDLSQLASIGREPAMLNEVVVETSDTAAYQQLEDSSQLQLELNTANTKNQSLEEELKQAKAETQQLKAALDKLTASYNSLVELMKINAESIKTLTAANEKFAAKEKINSADNRAAFFQQPASEQQSIQKQLNELAQSVAELKQQKFSPSSANSQ